MADILIVDDQAEIRRVMCQALEGAGHTVAEAEDGGKALERLRTGRFDLVITDMHMPDVDGLELTRVLRLRPAAPKIIGITGDDKVNLDVAEMLGAKATLSKPFTPAQLIVLVAKVLGATPDE